MKKSIKLLLFAGLILSFILPLHVDSQQQQQQQPAQKQQPAPITVHQVKGDIYEVKGGSGANAGFFIGEKEVLVIDAKMSEESAKQMIAEIKKLTPKPVKYVILTHSDGDHVNGLVGFSQDVTVVSHSQSRKHMDEAFKEPNQRLFLPSLTFTDKMKIYSGNKVVKLLHFVPAHTDGDVVVFFPEEKVAFMGDLIFLGRDPLIHRHKNGSFSGAIKTLKSVLELNVETFAHGHGDIVGRADIEGYIKSLEEKQAKIKALVAEGKTLEEIKKIYNIEDRPAQPGRPRFMSVVEVIYLELTEKK